VASNTVSNCSGQGELQPECPFRLYVNLEFAGIEEFADFIPLTDLSTSGTLEAHVTGKPDSLNLEARLLLDSTLIPTSALKNFSLMQKAFITVSDTLFSMNLVTRNLVFGEFALDSAAIQMEGSLDSVFTQTQLINNDIYTNLHAGIVPGERIRITIPTG
jgi:translocation and assembly module TamB